VAAGGASSSADLKVIEAWVSGWLCGLAAAVRSMSLATWQPCRVIAVANGTLNAVFDSKPGWKLEAA
jgi:hypothetical protein